MKKKKIDTSWGKVAPWYDALLEDGKDSYQEKVILPHLLRAMDLKKGERVLDIACGQGFFTRAFAAAGAMAEGADISPELIGLAKTHSHKGIPFHVAPADKLAFAASGSYDAAAIVLALQNMERMDAALSEARRVLMKNGRLFLVLNHPAFRVPRRSRWGFDENEKTQYRRVDGYLSADAVAIEMHPGKSGGPVTYSYHRSLQDIVKALGKQGFFIVRLEEWISHKKSGAGPRQKAEDTARKEIPLFLFLEARALDA